MKHDPSYKGRNRSTPNLKAGISSILKVELYEIDYWAFLTTEMVIYNEFTYPKHDMFGTNQDIQTGARQEIYAKH